MAGSNLSPRALTVPRRVARASIFLRNGARVYTKAFQGQSFVVISILNPSNPDGARDEIVFPRELIAYHSFMWIVFKPCVLGVVPEPEPPGDILALDYQESGFEVVSIPVKFVEFVEFTESTGSVPQRIVF